METFIHDADLPYEFNSISRLGVDTETGGLKPRRDALRLVQLNVDNKNIHIVRVNPAIAPLNLIALLENRHVVKVFHYARFDMGFLLHHLGVSFAEDVECTKIMSKLVRTYSGHHGLASIYSEMTGEKMSKIEATTNWGAETLTPEQIEYAAKDVRHLLDMRDWLRAMFDENPERWDWAEKAFDFLPARVELDLAGFDDMDIFSH